MLRCLAPWFTLLITAVLSAPAAAQQTDFAGEMPLDDYLQALAQIAPAARTAADQYLAAFHRRCGRTLTARELRRAVADGAGDPVLMRMIGAAQQQDQQTLRALAATISCAPRR